jgi:hypothetical protein
MKKILSLISAAVLSTCAGIGSVIPASAVNFNLRVSDGSDPEYGNNHQEYPNWVKNIPDEASLREFAGQIPGATVLIEVTTDHVSGQDHVKVVITKTVTDEPDLHGWLDLDCVSVYDHDNKEGERFTRSSEFNLNQENPTHTIEFGARTGKLVFKGGQCCEHGAQNKETPHLFGVLLAHGYEG